MWRRRRLEWATAAFAVLLGVSYLLLPLMGTDLSAQTARAGFFSEHGYTPIDLRWYGGVDQLGYSWVSQPVMALFGVRVTGVLALLFSSVLFALLLRRTGATRPWLGSLAGTICFAAGIVSGRITYGLGVVFALAALVALTYRRLTWVAAVAAFLASATSPVAGLFLGLAAAALIGSAALPSGFAGEPRPFDAEPGVVTAGTGRVPKKGSGVSGALVVGIGAALPLALSAGFLGDGGWMNISRSDTEKAVVAGLAVALLVPRRAIRLGAVLAAAGVLAAALVHTPVGLNATRLAVMFTLPLLAAYARLPNPFREQTGPRWATGLALVVVLAAGYWWQPPVLIGDVQDMGNPTSDRAYFAPLLTRLAQERLTGRVEIPPTRDYWEAAYMGDVPLARGWLRQADIARDPLFFTTVPGASGTGVPLTAASYRDWLAEQAVQFVAVPDAELSWSSEPEAELVTQGQPYLTLVWQDAHWHLYAVNDAQPVVGPPATLVGQTSAAITFTVPAAADVPVRIHYYPWLHVNGKATIERTGDDLTIHVPAPGKYTLNS